MTIESANHLAELRRAHGLSQEDLAEQLGVSRQAVSKWERAESSPDTDNLIALAQLYGVTLDELLGLRLPPETPAPETAAPEAAIPEAAPAEAPDPDDPLPEGSYYEHLAQKAAREAEEAARQAEQERHRRRARFPYPLFVTIAYLVLGIYFHMWHPGWIIFLTIPLYYLPESERAPLRLLGNPVMVTIIYLLLGTMCNLWHPGWLIFLLIPLLNASR
ncbi:MAG: helix-turn-helix transcriptional regulator [Clostridia bacterium]|nr:helix-turn-helix transcriptional regulator [Clostridia bacterium]